MSGTNDGHCWHYDMMQTCVYPPRHTQTCCRCGAKRQGEHRQEPHGPHVPGPHLGAVEWADVGPCVPATTEG